MLARNMLVMISHLRWKQTGCVYLQSSTPYDPWLSDSSSTVSKDVWTSFCCRDVFFIWNILDRLLAYAPPGSSSRFLVELSWSSKVLTVKEMPCGELWLMLMLTVPRSNWRLTQGKLGPLKVKIIWVVLVLRLLSCYWTVTDLGVGFSASWWCNSGPSLMLHDAICWCSLYRYPFVWKVIRDKEKYFDFLSSHSAFVFTKMYVFYLFLHQNSSCQFSKRDFSAAFPQIYY